MQKIITIFFLFVAFSSYGQVEIESQDIINFIGKEVKVKAKVAGIYYGKPEGKVIIFNMVENFPKEVFAAKIFRDKLEPFGDLKRFEGKEVILKGEVSMYNKKVQIILNDAKQIELSN